jgi:hypothetical protein
LVILYVEIRLQMPKSSSKLKFRVNGFDNVFQHYSCHKGPKTLWLQYKRLEGIIQNNFIYFNDFLCCNEDKQTEQDTIFIAFELILCVICVLTARARNDYNINPRNTSFRTRVRILEILYVEIQKKQIIQHTSPHKYIFLLLH